MPKAIRLVCPVCGYTGALFADAWYCGRCARAPGPRRVLMREVPILDSV